MAFPDISTVRSYGGGALPSVLTGSGISSTGTSFTVADASTWVENGTSNPLGTSGPFVVAIDYGETNEEKVLCSSLNLTTNTVTVYSSGGSIGRAYDNCNVPLGTSAGTGVTHAANAVVVPVFTSVEAQAANNVGSKTLGLVTSPGDLLVGNGTQSLTRKAIGTSGQVLSSNGTTVNWQKVAPANVDPSGTSAGQVLISTGSSSAPTWQDNKGQAYVGSSTPSATISGALWWDTTNAILKVYNGGWIPTPGDSTWQTVSSFSNSWASTSGISYRKIGNRVQLRGQFTTAGTAVATAFTLPSGYHNGSVTMRFPTGYANSSICNVVIDTSGNVIPQVSATTWLDGITFLVD